MNLRRQSTVMQKCELRVADNIDMEDFEISEEEEEEDPDDDAFVKEEKKKAKELKKQAKAGKKPNKWYTEFVNFHKKKREIQELLRDKSRRGSVLEAEIDKPDSLWISNNEREMANAVVNTLMQAHNEKRRNSTGQALKSSGETENSLGLPDDGMEEKVLKAASAPVTPSAKKKKSILKKQKSQKSLQEKSAENTPKTRR